MDSLGSDPGEYNAKNLRDWINRIREIGPGAAQDLVKGLRKFVCYLAQMGKCPLGLERAIPAVAGWRHAALPSYLSSCELERIINSCEAASHMGVRDRAIILLLARLGLRSDDVAQLSLSGIDWEDGSLLVSGKTRCEARLPLPQEVGDALIGYLEERPVVDSHQIFLHIRAPFCPITSCGISQMVTRRMRKANIVTPRYGAHILRHTAATEMLREGVGLYEIGQVLRHHSRDMTALYAKVDFQVLDQVALPWPEVLT